MDSAAVERLEWVFSEVLEVLHVDDATAVDVVAVQSEDVWLIWVTSEVSNS